MHGRRFGRTGPVAVCIYGAARQILSAIHFSYLYSPLIDLQRRLLADKLYTNRWGSHSLTKCTTAIARCDDSGECIRNYHRG